MAVALAEPGGAAEALTADAAGCAEAGCPAPRCVARARPTSRAPTCRRADGDRTHEGQAAGSRAGSEGRADTVGSFAGRSARVNAGGWASLEPRSVGSARTA
jgi:hypothetical protein